MRANGKWMHASCCSYCQLVGIIEMMAKKVTVGPRARDFRDKRITLKAQTQQHLRNYLTRSKNHL